MRLKIRDDDFFGGCVGKVVVDSVKLGKIKGRFGDVRN